MPNPMPKAKPHRQKNKTLWMVENRKKAIAAMNMEEAVTICICPLSTCLPEKVRESIRPPAQKRKKIPGLSM